ncbi:MAG TPA: glycosyltransferase, partial [Polyangiaceae bacterium]|nr:glycosyltransferase [Polyangiaceae bacterium]
GIEPPRVKPELVRPLTRPRIVCVARLAAEKGHAGLIEAFAELVAGGADVELELLGDGTEAERLAAQVQRLGLTDRVQMRGQVSEDQALAAMSNATVVVLASFMEGLPVVLMEALALGVPVIAPCVAGIPELIEHNVSGLSFPPGDWASLARVMAQMLADPGLRQRLAAEGKRRIEAEFFMEQSLAPLIAAFKSMRAQRAQLT